jgi:hypothetical protein
LASVIKTVIFWFSPFSVERTVPGLGFEPPVLGLCREY